MNKLFLILPIVGLVAGCETSDQNAAAGALGGAVLGAAIADDNEVQGALIGAAAGVAASTLVRPAGNGNCVYRDQYGRQFTARC